MRYDVEAMIYSVSSTPDIYGGYTESLTYLYTVACNFTALGDTEQSKKFGLLDKQYYKVITLDDLPSQGTNFRLVIGGITYQPYTDRRFIKNRKVVMVERVMR